MSQLIRFTIGPFLPRRYWPTLYEGTAPPLGLVLVSGLLGIAVAAYLLIAGLSEYGRTHNPGVVFERAANDPTVRVVRGTVFAYFFTMSGGFATYLLAASVLRVIAVVVDDPIGDPMLSALDAVARRVTSTRIRTDRGRMRAGRR